VLMLHIKTTNGDDVWLNPEHIVSIEAEANSTIVTTTGQCMYIRQELCGPLRYHTNESPTDLMVQLRVELAGAK
jgi:hypothetical protein